MREIPAGTDPGASAGALLSAELLAWYDAHARVLPWRVPSGAAERPDPYRIWLSEVMLQQTTVAAVKGYFHRFTTLWPRVEALAAAEDDRVMAEWAGLGYYARARNLLACARAVVARGGFPDTRAELMTLPGIGPYTAAAIAAIAFGEPAVVVDGNVERVMARLHALETPLPAARPAIARLAAALTPRDRPGDYAQAVMDLGATICTPRRPACGICPWMARCAARAAGIQAELPRKAPKAPVPLREGALWLARRSDGAWLLERRPGRGMLGGMLGWPGSDWARAGGPEAPPLEADWRPAGLIRHGFTHFQVALTLYRADVGANAVPGRGAFVPAAEFRPEALPTLMRKAFEAAGEA